MSKSSKSFRTPMGRVRSLGAARLGTDEASTLHLTAVALVPLTIGFVWVLLTLLHMDYHHARQTLGELDDRHHLRQRGGHEHAARPQDADGNAVAGAGGDRAELVDCANVMVESDGPRVSAIGLRDVIVVVDGDEVLVTSAEGVQKVGKLSGAVNQ